MSTPDSLTPVCRLPMVLDHMKNRPRFVKPSLASSGIPISMSILVLCAKSMAIRTHWSNCGRILVCACMCECLCVCVYPCIYILMWLMNGDEWINEVLNNCIQLFVHVTIYARHGLFGSSHLLGRFLAWDHHSKAWDHSHQAENYVPKTEGYTIPQYTTMYFGHVWTLLGFCHTKSYEGYDMSNMPRCARTNTISIIYWYILYYWLSLTTIDHSSVSFKMWPRETTQNVSWF